MTNDCLLPELKGKRLIALSVRPPPPLPTVVGGGGGQEGAGVDEVRPRPDVAPPNKSAVNHAPSGALTSCRLEITPPPPPPPPLINAPRSPLASGPRASRDHG